MHALKYRNAHALARFLAQLLHMRLSRWGFAPALVTHLPTTSARRHARGYDQAELLAVAVARLLGVPHAAVLSRTAATPKLVGLGRRARATSLADALAAAALSGQSVLLIDDVLTTGATAASGRAALAQAGSGEVRVALVARTPPSMSDPTELEAAMRLLSGADL